MTEPSEETVRTWLRRYGLPAPEDREFGFHDYSGADLAEAFAAGWAAYAASIEPSSGDPNPEDRWPAGPNEYSPRR